MSDEKKSWTRPIVSGTGGDHSDEKPGIGGELANPFAAIKAGRGEPVPLPPDCPGCAKLRAEVDPLRHRVVEMERDLRTRILDEISRVLEHSRIVVQLPAAVDGVPINVTFNAPAPPEPAP